MQREKSSIMNKALITLTIMLLTGFAACSGNDGGKGTSNGNSTLMAAMDPADGQVVQLTAETFRKLVWDYQASPNDFVFKGSVPCIVDFYADWCRPCKIVAPIMDELAKEYKGKIMIYKVNTDAERDLARVFNINSIPAVLFVPKQGKPQMSVGALPKPTFVQTINEVLLVK